MKLKKTLKITIFLCLGQFFGCENDTTKDPVAGVPEAASTVEAPPAVGALSLLSPSEMMGFAVSAFSSARDSNAFSSEVGASLLDEATTADPDNPNCSIHAEPFDATNLSRLSDEDENYAKLTANCLIDTPSSSESITGKMAMVKGIICAFENALGTEIEYTEEGKVYSDVEVLINTDCFSETFVAENADNGMSSVEITFNAKDISKTTNFAQELAFSIPGPSEITLRMLSTEDIFAFHMGENLNDDTQMEASTVTVDRGAGVIQYDTISRRWGNHARLVATGDFSGSSFGEFDSLEMIWQRFDFPTSPGNDNTPSATDVINAPIATAKGNRNEGYLYRMDKYICGFDQSTPACTSVYKGGVFSEVNSSCVEGAGACEGNTGITLNADNFDYLSVSSHFDEGNDDNNIAAVKDWIAEGDVLCFSHASPTLLPNENCDKSAAQLALTGSVHKAYFAKSAYVNPRISGWADECEGKSKEVNSIYTIDASRLPNSSVSSISGGSAHQVVFNVLAARGVFWGDYDLQAVVTQDDVELATKDIVTAGAVGGEHEVTIPITLSDFSSTSKIQVHVFGTLTCKTESTAHKAFSMSLSTPVMRLIYGD